MHEKSLLDILKNKGRPDLAILARNGRVQHRIMFSIGGDVEDALFGKLFEGFLKLQLGQGQQLVTWNDWQSEAFTKYWQGGYDTAH